MRLSDAIALGRTLEPAGSGGSYCDCAIGLGMAAVGIPKEERRCFRHRKEWPWLALPGEWNGVTGQNDFVISCWFIETRRGNMTLDELIDNVRSIEPEEETERSNETTECKAASQEVAEAK